MEPAGKCRATREGRSIRRRTRIAKIADVVDKAYYGGMPDPTGGATHYYAGQTAEAVAARLASMHSRK